MVATEIVTPEVLGTLPATADIADADVPAPAVRAEHVRRASVALRMALHWHTLFSEGYPGRARLIAHHAAEAGRRMCWAGMPYPLLALKHADAAAVPAIWAAVRDGWFGAAEAVS